MKYFKRQTGFTLMEIVVASSVFLVVSVSIFSLFNYVLKINRRNEALRQASQGMRNFVEFLVKEVRNGQIDYYIANGYTYESPISGSPSSPCTPLGTPGGFASGFSSYFSQENKLGIKTSAGLKECFYLGTTTGGSYVDSIGIQPVTFTAPAGVVYNLVMKKTGVSAAQILNPPNFSVDKLMFLIRPRKDPYTVAGNGFIEVQPSVTILLKFTVRLPTGEQTPIYYQTSVSSNKYDIPNE